MKKHCLVIIGSSTGGPRALQYILSNLPADLSVSVIVVQHMTEKFTKMMAERLNQTCKLKIKEAVDGEEVLTNMVYITPGNRNLILIEENGKLKIRLSENFESIYRPSIDATFISAANVNTCIIAVILTGMGSDGSKGLKNLKEKGSFIICQDVDSSLAKGMPYNAIKTGYVDKVLPLEKIPAEIIKKVREFYGK
ncbi:MAG TPA: chemotaxis protein CheB [Clostridia bacterium]|nr:chemotaxis protein CheB [Clostridia bacterium]